MIRGVALACAVLAACGSPPRRRTSSLAWVDDVALSIRSPSTVTLPAKVTAAPTLADSYRANAATIIATAKADRGAYDKLRVLTDTIGSRLAGSAQLERAVEWAARTMRDDGHTVRTQDVMVPHWVRGAESGTILTPTKRPLHLIGLGGTVPTPRGGITAPVVVVHDWDELEAKKAEVAGAIVLYDVAMPAWTMAKGSGYGDVVRYRTQGPVEAAKRGAVGVLMRSVTARSLGTPHTGALGYDEKVTKIPAAAITIEDSALIARLVAAGEQVRVKLDLQSRTLPDAKSANVIGELRGRELPDEVVVIAAHLDSWDVGQGAHDDGAGVVMMMQALTTLKNLKLVPRRTVRVVLYTNEENGRRGAKAYFAAHAQELDRHVAALEADSGGFAPVGFHVGAKDPEAATRILGRLRELASVFAPLGELELDVGDTGADIDPLVQGGVPGLGLVIDDRTYFDYHHTVADTLDKVDPEDLAAGVAAVATMAYVLADLPARLDAPGDDPVFAVRRSAEPAAQPAQPAQ